MSDNELEKNFIKKSFKNLNRKLVCPYKNCQDLGSHFRCYDLSYEDCDTYIKFEKQRKQYERPDYSDL